jgi:flagellar FliL protein
VSAKASAVAAPAATPDAAADEPVKKSRKKLFMIVGAVLLLAAGGGGAWWYTSHAAPAKKEAEKKLPSQYFAMDPAFVVNLADTDAVRYLQADVQLATRDPETLKALQEQAPAIRNRLLLLFGQQTSEQLVQRSGKERLQDRALAEVKSVLKHEGAPDKVEAVIFTSLVTQ